MIFDNQTIADIDVYNNFIDALENIKVKAAEEKLSDNKAKSNYFKNVLHLT